MSAYLYPNLTSKKAYKEKIARGEKVFAEQNLPWGNEIVQGGTVCFEGPHYPKPHRFYGKATIIDGRVTKIV